MEFILENSNAIYAIICGILALWSYIIYRKMLIALDTLQKHVDNINDSEDPWNEIRRQVDKDMADNPDKAFIVGTIQKIDEDEASEETKKARDEFMKQRAEGGEGE